MKGNKALLSVFDKTGIVPFAEELVSLGWELLSSSGTADHLRKAGLPVTEVSDVTGYPHILGGRVKTLHPLVFGGILARRDAAEDMKETEQFGIPLLDMIVCNLYPFEETARRSPELEELLENIDIGGVSLLRAAAKNYRQVVVLTDPADYGSTVAELRSEGDVSQETRLMLALKAFRSTSAYDAAIVDGLSEVTGAALSHLPEKMSLAFVKKQDLRYGENPHQEASLYLPPLADLPWEQISGKPLSYNNILDADCAMRGSALLQDCCGALVVKHTTPCGMACGSSPREAYEKAVGCDPVSAFGGVVGISKKLDMETVLAIADRFTEVLLAPDYDEETVEILKEKKPSLRVLRWKGGRVSPMQFTGTWSGLLVQQDSLPPLPLPDKGEWIGKPRPDLWEDILFAWKVAALSKSNAISIVKNREAVGIGRGFCSRLHAVDFAVRQAGEKARGAVMGSDAFFPFSDCIKAAADAGIEAIIQPGGSIRDSEVFSLAEKLGISMFISGWRAFRH
ncbi:bifunctional phosphoribosylaminoimidazolecarboxamide formyltransferase/IMP cyclohydrolase [Aminivibrio sp.]|jgi:phosphoribosylaminoimidazolecarboxamide formyltransferase/IMP cyclohydrolase|uniref:bifunctional phosphoribosylaminoimidazolecarboxamide formyltransferase/IMP cyclohydrolase n=1 Tax=Aminivibrio sp. TaxID=1872489 RepID=UPI001A464689|nr:bifunctional phosphoribosylaminoimidazolecarboxamide formyltransferase/IMP cyclohydrolase [Aminivibrio sp.]MBL3538548.1 bifunctional phosphoribosylaminoimidazolecarboxamide formyltransferase/IMP cyclohydrolase [Aminivibrio sp.]MDK2958083.1 phosphoribosylaminoimidazolecarboxamide formyltransferase / cyclohydrolase [Synergistaceae bacterium]